MLPPFVLWALAASTHDRRRVASFAGAEPGIIGTVSLLFGLLAAFLADDIWTCNQIARQAVIEEADAIRNLARLAEGHPEITRLIRDALVD